jgi:chromosome segregation ATPase
LLRDRRHERDKENARQKEAIKQMESSLSAREKIYKERIRGLEQQVEVLKEQLAKEMRRRQMFISSTAGITNEMSEIRQNLDQSLFNVATSPNAKLDTRDQISEIVKVYH